MTCDNWDDQCSMHFNKYGGLRNCPNSKKDLPHIPIVIMPDVPKGQCNLIKFTYHWKTFAYRLIRAPSKHLRVKVTCCCFLR